MNPNVKHYRVEPITVSRPGPVLAEEPKCLIKPQSKVVSSGAGFYLPPDYAAVDGHCRASAGDDRSAGRRHRCGWTTEPYSRSDLVVVPCIMLAMVIRAILFVRRSLLDPLTQVRYWVSRVRSGDLTARMPALSTGEFNELADDINGLAESDGNAARRPRGRSRG